MASSRKMSGVEDGLKKMREQMVAEVERRFEDDMEYFDADGTYLGKKSRSDIHKNGNWHMAVQTFIVRKGARGQLQVLSQHRRIVDIAKSKWDHSTAVQMTPEDARDPLKGIRRGLEVELGIGDENIKQLRLVSDSITMRSSRKYGDEADDLYNREFVFVTVAELKDDTNIRPDPIKIDKVRWVDWDELVPAVLADAAHYTKNLRHNFVNTALAEHIRRYACRILGIKDGGPEPEARLIGSAFYSPPNNEDHALSVFADGKAAVEHLTASGRIEREYLKDEKHDVIDGLLQQPNLLPRYLYDKGMFGIDPKMIPAPDNTSDGRN
ncbi:MAG: NUDIX domain-containing protein [Candidatus Liptonbacteria bacterium]|nr:NUDIX domain-containing protein [Candidatus Liptonbacteria bacterium]